MESWHNSGGCCLDNIRNLFLETMYMYSHFKRAPVIPHFLFLFLTDIIIITTINA